MANEIDQYLSQFGSRQPWTPEDEAHYRNVLLDEEAKQNLAAQPTPAEWGVMPSAAGPLGDALGTFGQTMAGPLRPVSAMSPEARREYLMNAATLLGLGHNPLTEVLAGRASGGSVGDVGQLLSIYNEPVRSWPGEEALDEEARANYQASQPQRLPTEGGAIDQGSLLPITRYPTQKTGPADWKSASDVMASLDDGWRIEPFSRLSAPFKSMAEGLRTQPLLGPMVRPSQMQPEVLDQMTGDAMSVAGAGIMGNVPRVLGAAAPGTMELGIFGGRRGAETLAAKGEPRPLQALDTMERMEKAGASREEIWAATSEILKDSPYAGAFRGVDQKPRFEISDHGDYRTGEGVLYRPGKLRSEILDQGASKEGLAASGYQGRLSDVLEHRPLFDAYPDLANSTWASVPSAKMALPGYGGTWRGQGLGMEINADISPSLPRGKSITLHEAQHGVQDAEAFGKGGNMSMFSPEELRQADFVRRSNEIDRILDEHPDVAALFAEYTGQRERLKRALGPDWGEKASPFQIDRLNQAEQDLLAHPLGQKLSDMDWERAAKNADLAYWKSVAPLKAYEALAGEVEARRVQKRMDLSSDERRTRPPWMDDDIPERDQIVRFGNSGASMSMPEVPRSLDPLGYYSPTLEAAHRLSQAKGTPEQMLAQLKKAGAKDAEIEATGLKQFLSGSKGQPTLKDGTPLSMRNTQSDGRFGVEAVLADRPDELVASADFLRNEDGTWTASSTFTNVPYRRKGAASAVYDYAQSHGLVLRPETRPNKISDAAKAMWDKRGGWGTAIYASGEDLARRQAPKPKSVTRDEIIQHMEGNRPNVHEVRYAQGQEALDDIALDEFGNTFDSIKPEQRKAVLELAGMDPATKYGEVSYADYSLDPSNPTYRETVLHLPEAPARPSSNGYWEVDPGNGRPPVVFADEASARAHAGQAGGTPRPQMIKGVGDNFRSGHFNEPNIVGHMMTSETINPADGKKVFTVDQIQSDWGQKLRDGGVRDEAKIAGLKEQIRAADARWNALGAEARTLINQTDLGPGLEKSIQGSSNPTPSIHTYLSYFDSTAPDGRPRFPAEVRAKAQALYDQIGDAIRRRRLYEAELATAEASAPGHPMVNTTDQWTNLVLRRALRQAAEANAEYIAIPSGDTVLSYNPGKEHGMAGFYGGVPGDYKHLIEFVRNEAAFDPKRLIRNHMGPHEFADLGDALGVKGDALDKLTYGEAAKMADRRFEGIVPKNLRSILSKTDKSVKPEHVETLDSPSGATGLGQGFTLFRLTPDMKAKILKEGQPMFAKGGSVLPRSVPEFAPAKLAMRAIPRPGARDADEILNSYTKD